jgi:hypothetical protein
VARYYLCETGEHETADLAELGRPEHQEFRWVSFDQAETCCAALPRCSNRPRAHHRQPESFLGGTCRHHHTQRLKIEE